MTQAEESILLEDMTLLITWQTDDDIVVAADGMGYRNQAGGNLPYQTQKLFVANNHWIIGIVGWAGIEVRIKELESEIASGQKEFAPDIDNGGPKYLEALYQKAATEIFPVQGGTRLILCGMASDGPAIKIAQINPREGKEAGLQLLEGDKLRAFGSQQSTAVWLLNTFADGCESTERRVDLVCFTIWQIAQQELTVGQYPRYAISTAIVNRKSRPVIQTPDPLQMKGRLDSKLAAIKAAYGNSATTSLR